MTFNRQMFGYFTDREYLPCETCGTSLTRAEHETHVCDAARRARFETFQIRHALADFDREFAAFLRSSAGRFALFDAQRDRLSRQD